ncbi:Ribosomal_L29 domain containing protein [Thermogladius calderae 1633]|uniref:Large ribosomal subunit protein uL29 n=1 Tax=Thermogladius calderae (strain DSM 22663 / VKM B-2946 / 1633) TaxID=1184251 RepID=I3TDC0_THEC1|nr:Ribosomal_L29 domain containing protein [Thermogladius calderae 1633]
MPPEERVRKLIELRIELVKLKMQSRVGTLTNTSRIRNIKRDIARILTVMREEASRESSVEETTRERTSEGSPAVENKQ